MELIREINDNYKVSNAKDVYTYLDEFKNQDREMFIIIGLDSNNKPTYREINSIGTLNSSLVHPREVFKKAIIMSCNSIIIAHNHPSGNIQPSKEDKKITQTLVKAGELLQIKILDHIIIGSKEYYSFSENNEL